MEQRLLTKINKTTTCWNWTGYIGTHGYGKIGVDYDTKFVHRLAFEIWKHPIPNNMIVRHICDNRVCINPDHLILGTQQDNMNDKVERNRQAKGEKHGRVKLTAQDVREIKILLGFDISTQKVADMYNVHKSTIMFIKNGRNWKHI